MASFPRTLIIEFGGQLTPKIETRGRELGRRSSILSPEKAAAYLRSNPVDAIILSGGEKSVYEPDSPRIPSKVFETRRDGKPVPILGICYGMQALAHQLGGAVERGRGEYSANARIHVCNHSLLFADTPTEQQVLMSHGDSVVKLPPGCITTAESEEGGIAAFEDSDRQIYAVQYHPESDDTTFGKVILRNFIERICECTKDWTPGSLIASIRDDLGHMVGRDEKVISLFSGGVDSTVATALSAPILGSRLTAFTIDAGQLREGELGEIRVHARAAGARLHILQAQEKYLASIAETIDAEEKRKRFQTLYRSDANAMERKLGASHKIQGTLAPDRIESGETGGALIKTHHNTGLLSIEPLAHFFKYEVREIGKELGLPKSVWARMPFPGPGLYVRVIGVPVTRELLGCVRWADAHVRKVLTRHGLYHLDYMSQLVVAYDGLRVTGVKGDARAYAGRIAVRAVKTLDFMTATGIRLPDDVMHEIRKTLNTHPLVVGVYNDDESKPPRTTEFE